MIREGKKAEEILKQIDEDEDVSVLVLGASTEAAGPGPLVAAFAAVAEDCDRDRSVRGVKGDEVAKALPARRLNGKAT